MTTMEKQWFILHTLSGQEAKVKDSIDRRIKIEELADYVGEVLIPTEKVSEVKHGKKTTKNRKFFPGYVLVNLHLLQTDGQLCDRTWYFIQDTPGIIPPGFIGGRNTTPLREEEVQAILQQLDDKQDKVKPKVAFEAGESVKINDGPFLNFTGVIEEIDPERGKLKVSVSIFGRSAPVELEYWQVERG